MEGKKFIFSNNFDSDFLFNLYDEDYQYVAEILQQTLIGLREDIPMAIKGFQEKDLERVRKTIHKIKPAFGFAGLTDMQNDCQQFETLCSSAPDTASIASQFEAIVKKLDEHQVLLEHEYNRLIEFNTSNG